MLRGPAGSGKSYLAFGQMFSMLEDGKIDNSKFTEASNKAINLVLEIEKFDKEDGDSYTTVEKTFTDYTLLGIDGTDRGFINASNVDANGVLTLVNQ